MPALACRKWPAPCAEAEEEDGAPPPAAAADEEEEEEEEEGDRDEDDDELDEDDDELDELELDELLIASAKRALTDTTRAVAERGQAATIN